MFDTIITSMVWLSMSFSNPNSVPGIFDTIQFTCNSHLLQLFYSFISLNFPLYHKEMLHCFLSQKVQNWKTVGLCTTAATCVDTYFKSQGQTIDHVIVDLEKPFDFHHLHSMHMLHYYWVCTNWWYPVAKGEIPSASYETSTTTSSRVILEDLCKAEPRLAKLAEETKKLSQWQIRVQARRTLDSHRSGREKELGEGKRTLIFYSTDLNQTEKDPSM
jgi:hypothetical protein